jgi:hypothetical protein
MNGWTPTDDPRARRVIEEALGERGLGEFSAARPDLVRQLRQTQVRHHNRRTIERLIARLSEMS